MNLLRGQRANLSDLFSYSLPFTIKVVVNAPNLIIDFSCFGLDVNNKLPDDRYMAFFNQPVTPCGSVRFKCSDKNTAAFIIDLQKLPTHIDRLVITAAIDGDGAMSQLISGAVALCHSNIEVATFAFAGDDFKAEKALMLMEIYRKEVSTLNPTVNMKAAEIT
jgi:tellurite resistance protein TerA